MDLASGHVAALNKLKKEHLRLKVDGSAAMTGLRETTACRHISEDFMRLFPYNKHNS
jgi:transposase